MIDEVAAREFIMKMNKTALGHLLQAMNAERYLCEVFGDQVDVNYSPPVATVVVKYRGAGKGFLANLAASVTRAVRETPLGIVYFGRRFSDRPGFRMTFPGGLAIVAEAISP